MLYEYLYVIRRGMQRTTGRVDWDDVGVCRTLRETYGLDSRQARICKSWRPVMQHVSRAAALAVVACQTVLRNKRWNCSSAQAAPRLSPELVKGWKTRFNFYFLLIFFFLILIARMYPYSTNVLYYIIVDKHIQDVCLIHIIL